VDITNLAKFVAIQGP